MLELPETLTLAKELNAAVIGKTVADVRPPTKPHKFCWFSGEPAEYATRLRGRTIEHAEGFGIYAELVFSSGIRLCINDGVNLRLVTAADIPRQYQLLIFFTDSTALVYTVAMYGGIFLHDGELDNAYYQKSRNAILPGSDAFSTYFYQCLSACKPTMSAKAFLATEQRFPGIGNGVVQDILFAAGIHPKRKLQALSETDRARLLHQIPSVLQEMLVGGGRDTEKNLFGLPGGYHTKMSKHTLEKGCPVCGGAITKETYLGGAIYYCLHCQPLPQK